VQEVNQATGRRHDDLPALLQLLFLPVLWNAAVDAHGLYPQGVPVVRGDIIDLHAKLAGRREDQGNRALATAGTGLGGDVGEGGKNVSQCLATSGLGDTDEIVPLEDNRPGLSLDRCWILKPALPQLFLDIPIPIRLLEG